MIKIVISGICGKMGQRIKHLASEDKDFKVISGLEASDNPAIGKTMQSDFNKIVDPFDVLIEFATPKAAIDHLQGAIKKKVGVVIGTTAFSPEEIEKIKEASREIAVVFSPNMSTGANLLFKLAEEASSALAEDYEVEIVEAHHSQKKDAPSGTAKRLGEAVSRVRGKAPPIHSIREGNIVGDHTVIFAGKNERIEITHRAYSRDAFAKGALDAARFIVGKSAGLYSMQDVIKAH